MLVGDVEAWADKFVTFDERFLERIVAVWPACMAALPGQPGEDNITINLVALLAKDETVRRLCHWIEYQYEPFGFAADGSRYSKGKIDIGVVFDWERDRYLAYECKRLNVINKAGRSSLATAYVTEGMMRFMTEQYAEGLPVGCMLGYVLDNDVAFARERVERAIAAHTPLRLTTGPTSMTAVGNASRLGTRHRRSSTAQIELRHTLLPRD